MTRRTLILAASLVAVVIDAVGFVAADRPLAAELNVTPSRLAPGIYEISRPPLGAGEGTGRQSNIATFPLLAKLKYHFP